MNLALILLKKKTIKAKTTNIVEAWLDELSEVNLINFVKLKRALNSHINDVNYDINEDSKVDLSDYSAWVDYLVKGTVPPRFAEVSSG